MFRPKPDRDNPNYRTIKINNFEFTECMCFFCDYQRWTEETPGFHRQYHISHNASCKISRANSEINECNKFIDEAMNNDTFFDCIEICELLQMKQNAINDLARVKQKYFNKNWDIRKNYIFLCESNYQNIETNYIEQYLFNEYILKNVCSYLYFDDNL